MQERFSGLFKIFSCLKGSLDFKGKEKNNNENKEKIRPKTELMKEKK
jgi:hypothetical protein